jgi:hypothetical protein
MLRPFHNDGRSHKSDFTDMCLSQNRLEYINFPASPHRLLGTFLAVAAIPLNMRRPQLGTPLISHRPG